MNMSIFLDEDLIIIFNKISNQFHLINVGDVGYNQSGIDLQGFLVHVWKV